MSCEIDNTKGFLHLERFLEKPHYMPIFHSNKNHYYCTRKVQIVTIGPFCHPQQHIKMSRPLTERFHKLNKGNEKISGLTNHFQKHIL